jgi:hypothetical protein
LALGRVGSAVERHGFPFPQRLPHRLDRVAVDGENPRDGEAYSQ